MFYATGVYVSIGIAERLVFRAFFLGVLLGCLWLPLSVRAQVISEIMYDPAGTDTGREWVEIFNDTNGSIDLTRFKLFESNVNHGLASPEGYTQPAGQLTPGSHAVIADNPTKFLEDFTSYASFLYDSAFSLVNTGEELRLVDASGNATHAIAYSSELGAKNTGASLQLSSGAYIAAEPTPGAANATTPTDTVPDTATSTPQATSGASAHASQVELSVVKEKPVLPVTAGRDRLVSLFSPVAFSGLGSDADNKLRGRVTFLWNFGDGYTGKGFEIDHTYKHPGTYHVVLNAIAGGDRAVARTRVSVFEPIVSLALSTSTVDLTNMSAYELNLGGFYLDGFEKRYTFPKDTLVSPGQMASFGIELFMDDSEASLPPPDTLKLLFPNTKPVPVQ